MSVGVALLTARGLPAARPAYSCRSRLRLVEQLEHPVRGTGDNRPPAPDDDGSLDEHRVGGHGVEELVIGGVGQPELAIHRLLGADDRARAARAEQLQDPLDLGPRRPFLQVLEQLGVDALLGEDSLGGAAGAARRVEPHRHVLVPSAWWDCRAMSERNRRALVTGATGYIASHLIPALVASGWEVLATGRRREPPDLPDGVDYTSVDLVRDDPWAFSSLMESVTHVFHLAGASSSLADQEEMEKTNVAGTRRILQATKGWPVERFVHMSSTSVYGEEVQLPSPVPEDVGRHPSRGYGKAKDGAERVVEEFAAEHGVPTVVLRPVTVYGPGNVKLLASAILDVAIERYAGLERIAVHATPIEQRLVHVDDVVAASIHLATADGVDGRAFNVVVPEYPSSHQVAAMVADAFWLPLELVDDPDGGLDYEARAEVHGRMVEAGMNPKIILSKERFRFLRKANRNNRLSVDALLGTGFEFGQRDLPAAIGRTVDWYREHRWVV